MFLLGYNELLCFCLSRNCFIIVLLVTRNHWVIVIILVFVFLCVLVSTFFWYSVRSIVRLSILCSSFFRSCCVLEHNIDCLFNWYYRGKHVVRGCSLCTALHLLDDYRSIPLELEVCSCLWSGFRGWNLCATECSCGYNRGFIEGS